VDDSTVLVFSSAGDFYRYLKKSAGQPP